MSPKQRLEPATAVEDAKTSLDQLISLTDVLAKHSSAMEKAVRDLRESVLNLTDPEQRTVRH